LTVVSVVCRGGHAEDVNDACWAPDATALLTGSIENVCMVWDVSKGKGQGRLTDHGHYVQGVAWDPAQQYVVSQSADRTCRQACLHFGRIMRCIQQISLCGAEFEWQRPGILGMQVLRIANQDGVSACPVSDQGFAQRWQGKLLLIHISLADRLARGSMRKVHVACRVYGPKVAALGKRGKSHPNTAITMSKDLICQNILSRRQLPPGKPQLGVQTETL